MILIEDVLNNILDKIEILEDKIDELNGKKEEDTKILRALEHKADIHKAEIDKLNNELAHLSGGISDLNKSQKDILNNLENIGEEIDIISINTAKNQLDIARMKSAE